MMPAEPHGTASRPPGMWAAVLADASCTAAFRGERHEFRSRLDALAQVLRLAAASDAFLGQVLYRLRAGLQRRRVPLLPRVLNRLTILAAGIYIGDRASIHPGIYIVHGQVVIGAAEVHSGAVISPAVTIDSDLGSSGPTIGRGVSLGTGSRVLGDVSVGARARIGANAVVLTDVPGGATAVGVPARIKPRDG